MRLTPTSEYALTLKSMNRVTAFPDGQQKQ